MGRFDYNKDNIEKDLARLEKSENAVQRDIVWHRLQFGDNHFRLIPDEDGTFYHIEYSHFLCDNISPKSTRPVTCHYYKSNKKEKCPVCEAYFALPQEDRNKRRDLKVTTTYLLKAIDKDNRIGILSFNSVNVFRKLLRLIAQSQDEYGINVFSEGAVINIMRVKTGPKQTDVEYDVKLVQKPKKVDGKVAMFTHTQALTETELKAADELPKLDAIYSEYSKDEIVKMMNGDILDRFKEKQANKPTAPAQETKANVADTVVEEPALTTDDVDDVDEEYKKILQQEV